MKRDVFGNLQDSAHSGAANTIANVVQYIKQLVGLNIARDVAIGLIDEEVNELALRTCVKTDGAILTGDDDLFVITGGPVRAKIVGVVTTVIGDNVANGDLRIDVTEPAGTVDLNAAPVAITSDAAGTVYTNIDSTSVFTPTTAGASIVDKVAADEAFFILPVGTVIFRSSAANTGVIAWCMTYEKLSPLSRVVAAE